METDLGRLLWVSLARGYLSPVTLFPSAGRTDAEYPHPSAGSPHAESHWPFSHVLPHRRPHTEGNARPELA